MNARLRYLTTGLPRLLLAAGLLLPALSANAQMRLDRDQRFVQVQTPLAAPSSKSYPFAGPQATAKKLDHLVEQQLQKDQIKANAEISDEVFLRRIYLDVIGRVPNYQEASSFLNSKDLQKRDRLIDQLLASEGYVAHAFNYWSDLLRVKTRLLPGNRGQEAGAAYMDWLKQALASNIPYDQMVRELLSATGSAYDNGAVGYYLRDAGMALDNMAVTTQIFMGTQMVCAQCHDHPFDKWTQMDYYQLAAHSSAMTNFNGIANQSQIFREYGINKMKQANRRIFQRALNDIAFRQRFTKVVATNQPLRLPTDYQYENAKPLDVIHPVIPAGFSPTGKSQMIAEEGRPPIEAYAQWMTSKDNPRFTMVIANRLWKQVFGLGVIEPVDELTDNTKAHNPELVAFLTDTMKAVNYDIKAYLSVLYRTKTYQRAVTQDEVNDPTTYAFQGPLLRRMSAEQIWDSMVSLVLERPDAPNPFHAYERHSSLTKVRWMDTCLGALTPEELISGAKQIAAFQLSLAKKSREEAVARNEGKEGKGQNSAQRQRRQAFERIDDEVLEIGFQRIVRQIRENPLKAESKYGKQTVSEIQRVLKDAPKELTMVKAMNQTLDLERRQNQEQTLTAASEEFAEWNLSKKDRQNFRNYVRNRERDVVRAADLRHPAPNGHFLRAYGQSDREVVDNFNREASVMQALYMMNGNFFNMLSSRHSHIMRQVFDKKSQDERLEILFLSTFSRKPTVEEKQVMDSIMTEKGAVNYGDALWTLLNTKQFIFIQ